VEEQETEEYGAENKPGCGMPTKGMHLSLETSINHS